MASNLRKQRHHLGKTATNLPVRKHGSFFRHITPPEVTRGRAPAPPAPSRVARGLARRGPREGAGAAGAAQRLPRGEGAAASAWKERGVGQARAEEGAEGGGCWVCFSWT